MRFHLQRSIEFCAMPRVRVYRRPLLIWIRWLGTSLFIDRAPAVCSKDGTGGAA